MEALVPAGYDRIPSRPSSLSSSSVLSRGHHRVCRVEIPPGHRAMLAHT